jgi:hypothetical protein
MEYRYSLGRSPGKIISKNYITGKKMETYLTGGNGFPSGESHFAH